MPTKEDLPPRDELAPRHPAPLADVIAEIREQHRMRTDYHSAEKRLTNQIKAIERRTAKASGVHPDAANQWSRDAQDEAGDEPLQISSLVSVHLADCRAQIEAHRKAHEKRVAVLAQQLPAWSWVEARRGFGALGLGQIVGEAGNISDYADPAKLWKRMGLAVINGERQRRVADADLAREHGYSPRRRAVMFCLGDSMIRAKGVYYPFYSERKAHELERPWCGSCRPAGSKKPREHCTPGHAHNRARRYMEKRMLRDLWRAWTGS